MAVGMAALIPLYRVQPDPNARFQRFGVNDTQLFGKPMIDIGNQATAAPAPPPRKTESNSAENSRQTAQETWLERPPTLPKLEATYGDGKGSATGTSLGTQIDFKA